MKLTIESYIEENKLMNKKNSDGWWMVVGVFEQLVDHL